MKKDFKILALMLASALLLCLVGCGSPDKADVPDAPDALQETLSDVAQVLVSTIAEPMPGSIGGEWAVIGLARWDGETDQAWFGSYYAALEQTLKDHDGVLEKRKYTEYSRAILAVTAMGENPQDVAGYDLLMPLADYEQTCWQGINGPIWALIALDSGSWELPADTGVQVQASRQLYVQKVLDAQQENGGWGLAESQPADIDVTAMALQALSNYTEQEAVTEAVEAGITWLSQQKRSSCESAAQVIVALTELGISVEDERFASESGSPIEELLTFYREGKGFVHEAADEEPNLMSTEQAFYAMVSVARQRAEKTSLFAMRDVQNTQDMIVSGATSEGKPLPVEPQDKTLTSETGTCTISIRCDTILNNLEKLDQEKLELVPKDGVILAETEVTFQQGENVFDLLQRVTRENKIHMEYVDTPLYNSAYIEGIGNLYEFDCGDLSGWNYCVNDWFPNYGCSRYALTDGDVIQWVYTCDLGRDVGDNSMR